MISTAFITHTRVPASFTFWVPGQPQSTLTLRQADPGYTPTLTFHLVGANGYVRSGSPAAVLHGRIERMARSSLILTFGGGTNEVQRDIIAGAGLRLPASGR